MSMLIGLIVVFRFTAGRSVGRYGEKSRSEERSRSESVGREWRGRSDEMTCSKQQSRK